MAQAVVSERESCSHTVLVLLAGAVREPEALPLPNWPKELLPQQVGSIYSGGAGGRAGRGGGAEGGPAMPQAACAPRDTDVHDTPVPEAVGVVLGVVDPSPSWPLLLAPQQKREPELFMAHDEPVPSASVDQPVEVPMAIGRRGVLVLPSPTWPTLLRPCETAGGPVLSTPGQRRSWSCGLLAAARRTQHHRLVSLRIPQLWKSPVAREFHQPSKKTTVGVSLWVRVPSPTWPCRLAPCTHTGCER